MQRWTIAVLALLLAVALAAPSSALAQPPSTNTFKGKASFYEGKDTYLVVNFTCSSGNLSGNWTYEADGQSYSGALVPTNCALSNTGGVWSGSFSDGPVSSNPPAVSGTVGLTLTDVTRGKTYVPSTANNCGGSSPCIEGSFTSNTTGVASFDSSTATPEPGYGYATLTLSVH